MSCSRVVVTCLFTTCWGSINFNSPLLAQIIPDNTLYNESSIVTPQEKALDLIEGGAIRGDNLFHSFEQFNIRNGNTVYFNNPDGIANILTRVTGNNVSEIFGTLGVAGAANLFLLNPNGIVFGENAALDVNGSFLATTADSYIFNNNFQYSATTPEVPPLLTINIPIGLQFGTQAEAIKVAPQIQDIDNFSPPTLYLAPEQTLALIGGNIEVERGEVNIESGNIQLGSVAENSYVAIDNSNAKLSFNYENVELFKDITLAAETFIDVSGNGTGTINLQGKNIVIDNSFLQNDNLGSGNSGKISLNATEQISLLGYSEFTSSVMEGGKGGNIEINSNELSIQDSVYITSGTLGDGDVGDIIINSNNTYIGDNNVEVSEPYLFSGVSELDATGNAGNIIINSDYLSIQGETLIASGTFGAGNGGNIIINSNNIDIVGYESDHSEFLITLSSGVYDIEATGNAGQIEITAQENLVISNDSSLGTTTVGGKSGGDIFLTAKKIQLENHSAVDTISFGKADSGNININAAELIIDSGAFVIGSTVGEGDAGSIDINASDSITIIGEYDRFSPERSINSGILAGVYEGGTGKGSNISLKTPHLEIVDGGVVTANVLGEGNGGDIAIDAEVIKVSNSFPIDEGDYIVLSGITNNVESVGIGNGGDIKITGEQLQITNGGNISASTFGRGNAGNIELDIADIKISGAIADLELPSTIGVASQTEFAAGSIAINSNQLVISDRATISVSNTGSGNSGNLTIVSDELNLDNSATIEAEVNTGNRGNINLTTDNIFLQNNSNITVRATGIATGGNINIQNTDNITLLNNSQIIANAIAGNGGNIQINTQGYFVSGDSLVDASSQLGLDGNIEVETITSDRPLELNSLPENPTDATEQITTGCGIDNNFAIAGKGGLPENPIENLRGQSIWQDLRNPEFNNQQINNQALSTRKYSSVKEASHWQVNHRGKIELIASSTTNLPLNNFNCQQNIAR